MTAPRPHLVIFAKAPRVGAVKQRLAADIGTVPAWRTYRVMLDNVLWRLAGDARWQTWLALAPDAIARAAQCPPGVRAVAQGPGDLGARMARPLRPPPLGLPPGPVVIVGSDVPGIERRHIAAAFAALGRAPYVFGPAADGGYWLVGARRRPHPPAGLFDHVRWSTRHALADTLANLRPGENAELLEELADVDDGAAYRRWRDQARATRSMRLPPR
jgi:rSAM/selenodomain-associated transferase 1